MVNPVTTARCAALGVWAAVAVSFTASPAAADDVTGFTSPSGNIGCMIEASYVRCDIQQRDWVPPPRPAECPSATGYGQGIELSAAQSPQFVCAGDTAFGGGPALSYGDSISAGVIRCTSAESGISCLDTRSGHGFTISRQAYRIS